MTDRSLKTLPNRVPFPDSDVGSLRYAIRRALLWGARLSLWRYVQRQTMSMDFSRKIAAKSFHPLYQCIL